MSTQRKPQFADDMPTENAVHNFLAENPDFFENHASLLSSLRLPHVAGGAVSLVERQVSVLRQKDLKLERKLKSLLDIARANDALGSKIHRLTLGLLAAKDLKTTLAGLEDSLRADFDASQSILVLFGDPEVFSDINVGRFFIAVPRDDDGVKSFDTFLNGSGPRCGQIRDAQRDFLFGTGTDEVGSVALIPLGAKAAYGFLAIGSIDAQRFHPGMSVDFLTQLGEIVAEALKRF